MNFRKSPVSIDIVKTERAETVTPKQEEGVEEEYAFLEEEYEGYGSNESEWIKKENM